MAPSAVSASPNGSVSHEGEPDVNLTASALQHKLAAITGDKHANGHANGAAVSSALSPLDASRLVYTFTKNPRPVPADLQSACSGVETICTDHMVVASWNYQTGWAAPEIKPYGPFSLMPTASVLHYATECFDGMKAYRGFDGKLRLFRPALNAARLRMSALRITLPGFEPEALEALIVSLMALDGPKWLPRSRPGTYLYLRPAMIATQAQLGVQVPKAALLFVTASFLPKLDTPLGGQRLHTSPEDTVRAWVGGFGYAKIGANYAPSFPAMQEAHARGFGQVLWLYGREGFCTEAGTSNFFVVWRRRDGVLEMVTAPLDDRLILDGVNRRSVLDLARERLCGEMEVVERRFSIDEVLEADKEGRLLESFVTGTAYFISPVSLIHHRGHDLQISMGKDNCGGIYTQKIKSWMTDIMWGREQHEWGVVVEEQE